jgi:hypothetical protein
MNEGVVLRSQYSPRESTSEVVFVRWRLRNFRIGPPLDGALPGISRALAADSIPICDSTAVTSQRLHERARHANLAHQQYRDRWTGNTVPVHIQEESYEA